MEIDGHKAILTYKDQVASGLPREVSATEIDMLQLFGRLAQHEHTLTERRAADDHVLSHWERATLSPDAARLQRHYETLVEMAGKLTVYKAELFLSEFYR